jgi:hypothetical protein
MGQKMVQVISGTGGWMINPMAGSSEPQEMPAEQAKGMSGAFYIIPLLNYKEHGSTAELQGKEKVGDGDAWKVKVTDKDGNAVTYHFDAKTYYIVQQETGNEMGGLVINYSDFRKTESGWVVPYAQEMNVGQMTVGGKLNKIEVNPVIDPALFEMKK